jgi:hypothetical protein
MGFVHCGREVYNAALTERRPLTIAKMRRMLLGLTLAVLLALSIGVGVLVAYWPSLSGKSARGEDRAVEERP